MAAQIRLRNGTSSAWSSSNPVLDQGEIGLETNTRRFKVGDGTTAWNSLAYWDQGYNLLNPFLLIGVV